MNKTLSFKVGFLMLAISSIFLLGASCGKDSGADKADAKTRQVAEALTASGATLYGAWWCPHCKDQIKLFGDAFEAVKYVECANPDKSQNAVCKEAGITSYPTWEFGDKTRYSGVLDMDQLIAKAKLTLPSTEGPASATEGS